MANKVLEASSQAAASLKDVVLGEETAIGNHRYTQEVLTFLRNDVPLLTEHTCLRCSKWVLGDRRVCR